MPDRLPSLIVLVGFWIPDARPLRARQPDPPMKLMVRFAARSLLAIR